MKIQTGWQSREVVSRRGAEKLAGRVRLRAHTSFVASTAMGESFVGTTIAGANTPQEDIRLALVPPPRGKTQLRHIVRPIFHRQVAHPIQHSVRKCTAILRNPFVAAYERLSGFPNAQEQSQHRLHYVLPFPLLPGGCHSSC